MKTGDIVIMGFEKELTDTYSALVNEIKSGDLSITSALCYFKHIPIREKHEGWPDEVYDLADKCHRLLYEYCKRSKYIKPDSPYDDYINGALYITTDN